MIKDTLISPIKDDCAPEGWNDIGDGGSSFIEGDNGL